jgi:hypothetical protein
MLKSLAIGNRGEEFAMSVLKGGDMEAVKNEDKETREYWDLLCKVGRTKFSCEVKYDVMAQKTGNIAIEFYNSKSCKDSGIAVTKSDIWVHILMDDQNMTMWIASVKEFRKFIKNNKPFRTVNNVGDNNACLHLYKEDTLLDVVFHRAETLSEDKLKKLVRKLLK